LRWVGERGWEGAGRAWSDGWVWARQGGWDGRVCVMVGGGGCGGGGERERMEWWCDLVDMGVGE
jgi:hypothetical protein